MLWPGRCFVDLHFVVCKLYYCDYDTRYDPHEGWCVLGSMHCVCLRIWSATPEQVCMARGLTPIRVSYLGGRKSRPLDKDDLC